MPRRMHEMDVIQPQQSRVDREARRSIFRARANGVSGGGRPKCPWTVRVNGTPPGGIVN